MMMTMTNEIMQGDHGQQLYTTRMIGRNCIHQSKVWVMSEVQLTNDGAVARPGENFFVVETSSE